MPNVLSEVIIITSLLLQQAQAKLLFQHLIIKDSEN